jgi:hypothetical protein
MVQSRAHLYDLKYVSTIPLKTSMSLTRPSTSKPRGVCRYYTHPRGCFAADKCKFLHGDPPIEAKPDDPPLLTPYDKAKRCRFYSQGLIFLGLFNFFSLMAVVRILQEGGCMLVLTCI